MRRRGRRWRVTYQLADDRGLSTTHMVVRAASERAAIDVARAGRAAWELERSPDRVGVFDGAWARPYTTGDGMDDGSSWASAVIWAGSLAFLLVLFSAYFGARGVLVSAAYFAWRCLEVVCAVGFVGYLLFGVAAVVYAGVTVLRERHREEEGAEG